MLTENTLQTITDNFVELAKASGELQKALGNDILHEISNWNASPVECLPTTSFSDTSAGSVSM